MVVHWGFLDAVAKAPHLGMRSGLVKKHPDVAPLNRTTFRLEGDGAGQLKESFKFELLWLKDHKTIEAVKIKMQPSKTLFAITRPDWQKAEAQINRQIADTIRQLVS